MALRSPKNNTPTNQNTNVVPFNFGGAQVRVLMQDGNPWFVATDVARVLGYRDAENMVRRLEDDDRATTRLSGTRSDGIRQGQRVTVINEPGLYLSVFGSNLPAARAFKKWVTSEVLPSIGKNGGYIAGQEKTNRNELTQTD